MRNVHTMVELNFCRNAPLLTCQKWLFFKHVYNIIIFPWKENYCIEFCVFLSVKISLLQKRPRFAVLLTKRETSLLRRFGKRSKNASVCAVLPHWAELRQKFHFVLKGFQLVSVTRLFLLKNRVPHLMWSKAIKENLSKTILIF